MRTHFANPVVRRQLPLCALLSLTALVTSASPPAQPLAPETAALHSELANLLNVQAAAWSRGDLDTFAAIYADDATFVSPSGMTRGKTELVERYRRKYPDRAAMGSLALEVLELRQVDERSASVVARWVLTYPDKPAVSGLTLLVFHRLGAGWRIVQDASM